MFQTIQRLAETLALTNGEFGASFSVIIARSSRLDFNVCAKPVQILFYREAVL